MRGGEGRGAMRISSSNMSSDELWCVDCGKCLPGECRIHGPLIKVKDRSIPSRARLSLPHYLALRVLEMPAVNKHILGVFAKKMIQKRTQFGPYVGQLSTSLTNNDDNRLVLQVLKDGVKYFLNTPDEEAGNWMMFVRPARNLEEQTLVAYQHQGEVYFTTVKNIQPQMELKVWYAADYAKFMEAPLVVIKQEPGLSTSPAAMETASRWKCSSCCHVFSTFSLLESHPCSDSGQGSVRGLAVTGCLGSDHMPICWKADSPAPDGQAKWPPALNVLPRDGQMDTGKEGKVMKVQKSVPCPLCKKVFLSADKLTTHSCTHSGERPHVCSHHDCAKAFISKYKLIRHMATHCPQKPHRCSHCEKMFHRKDHLKNHLQTHNPNKTLFRCGECGKRYNTKLGYRRHLAWHTATSGDLTCGVCTREFGQLDQLLEHLKGHAGRLASSAREKRHACDRCERRFYTRKDVRRHTVVHTGRKDFLCQFCSQRFGRKDHLTRHTKKSHAQELLKGRSEADRVVVPMSGAFPTSLKEEMAGAWPDPPDELEQKGNANMSTELYTYPSPFRQHTRKTRHVVPGSLGTRWTIMEMPSPILSPPMPPPPSHCMHPPRYQLNSSSYSPMHGKDQSTKIGTRSYNVSLPGDIPGFESQSVPDKESSDIGFETLTVSLNTTDCVSTMHKDIKPLNMNSMDISCLLGLPPPGASDQRQGGDAALSYGQGETGQRAGPLREQQPQQEGGALATGLNLTQLQQVSPAFPSLLTPTPLPRFHQVFQ
ncbi:zinc finger protein PLAG1-like isoform X1 [Hemiscyllium ocellatum]|uniref:zinc finger protein PLAG1-like isoform X1 n=2 Tax=Hemiscyllium ocellatum TaxID=170820 RepID=UPI002965D5D3|nr:zinc finger protein PLAG1-like isoform X1 [Hemiscyllium ocellatum]